MRACCSVCLALVSFALGACGADTLEVRSSGSSTVEKAGAPPPVKGALDFDDSDEASDEDREEFPPCTVFRTARNSYCDPSREVLVPCDDPDLPDDEHELLHAMVKNGVAACE